MTPTRPAARWEARALAERQAHRFHHLLHITDGPFPSEAIASLPRIQVSYAPKRRIAGALRWTGKAWSVVINSEDTQGRQRFSLAHELKHLIDHPSRHLLYRDHWSSSAELQAERAADYFAACLLMPKAWLKRLFYTEGIRDARVLARELDVSTAAMRYRLDQLKLHEPGGVHR
jgi:Zn-dependent peptidase ImmA (M78 family)